MDRQDRYMLIENNPLLADFFASIFDIVTSCSLGLDFETGSVGFSGNEELNPLTGKQIRFF